MQSARKVHIITTSTIISKTRYTQAMNLSEELEYMDIGIEDGRFNHSTGRPIERIVIEIGNDIVSLIGIICDILLVYAVLRNHRMKSRRNILLMYWAIFDGIGSQLVTGPIAGIINVTSSAEDYQLAVCLVAFTAGFFKINCVLLMMLLMSTTVARMHWIKENAFQWCLCVVTLLIYVMNFSMCYFVSEYLLFIKFTILFLILLIVLVVKEVNICCKARRDDPVSLETKVKINLVRIFTYNITALIISTFVLLHLIDGSLMYIVILEYFLHLTPLYMLVYLCIVDLNFRNAFRNCCQKSEEPDATVVYNVDGNKETVDFTRI